MTVTLHYNSAYRWAYGKTAAQFHQTVQFPTRENCLTFSTKRDPHQRLGQFQIHEVPTFRLSERVGLSSQCSCVASIISSKSSRKSWILSSKSFIILTASVLGNFWPWVWMVKGSHSSNQETVSTWNSAARARLIPRKPSKTLQFSNFIFTNFKIFHFLNLKKSPPATQRPEPFSLLTFPFLAVLSFVHKGEWNWIPCQRGRARVADHDFCQRGQNFWSKIALIFWFLNNYFSNKSTQNFKISIVFQLLGAGIVFP